MSLDQPHKGICPNPFAGPVDRIAPFTDIAVGSTPDITPWNQGVVVAGSITPLAKWF